MSMCYTYFTLCIEAANELPHDDDVRFLLNQSSTTMQAASDMHENVPNFIHQAIVVGCTNDLLPKSIKIIDIS